MTFRSKVHHSASLDRLESLIRQRIDGGDRETIDRRIWDLFGERWCVMFTDLAGFSRNVAEFGIVHFLQTIHESERVLIPVIEEHDGILLKTEGDSFLVIFRNADKGLRCAIAMQAKLVDYNELKRGEDELLLCVGLGYGDVLRIGEGDVFGAQVNAAAKLGEDTAGPGEILVTGSVREAASAIDTISYEKLDECPSGASMAYRVLWRA